MQLCSPASLNGQVQARWESGQAGAAHGAGEQGGLLPFVLAWVFGLDEVASDILNVSSYRSGWGGVGPSTVLIRTVMAAVPCKRG